MGYSQVEGVEAFTSTASVTSNRLIAVLACKLDIDSRHLNVDQVLMQSDSDTEINLRLPSGRDETSGTVG